MYFNSGKENYYLRKRLIDDPAICIPDNGRNKILLKFSVISS
jgi:hypothetical protein